MYLCQKILVSIAVCAVFHLLACTPSRYPDLQEIPKPALLGANDATLQTAPIERQRYEAFGREFMVVSQGEATTLAAKRILQQGGNAIDAAVAASFVIAVERPQSTGIGGGGFMMLHLAEQRTMEAVDFREQAPSAAKDNMYLAADGSPIPTASTVGVRASAVPGLVAGVLAVHKRYGRLPLATLLEPAIQLAESGFVIYPHLAKALAEKHNVLAQSSEGLAVFFSNRDPTRPLRLGERLKQPNLAKVLRQISKNGHDGFYKGWVADAIIAEQIRGNGLISLSDLAQYEVKFRKPLHGTFRGFDVYSMPPPSSGGIHVIEMLNIIEDQTQNPYSVPEIHRKASAMQIAFRDRAQYLGDRDFVQIPVDGLISKAYARAWQTKLNPTRALNLAATSDLDPYHYESPETTHFTIADQAGNVVSSTQTINGWFGSGVVVANTGIVMNNEMDDFSQKPGVPNAFGLIGSHSNAIAPRKRPLSSMSPTIIMQNQRPVLALGSPSGSQIINCVLLTSMNYLAHKMDLWNAVTALRYHQQWRPNVLKVEAPGFGESINGKLQTMGHNVEIGEIGCKVEAIAFEADGLHGVADPRGEGLAAGEKELIDGMLGPQNKRGIVTYD